MLLLTLLFLLISSVQALERLWPQYESFPHIIELDIPPPEDTRGGIITADLDGTGAPDFIVTVPGHIAAYSNEGKQLWILKAPIRLSSKSEKNGLPGHHAPGIQAADVDHDGVTEVLFLTDDSMVHAVNGETGEEEWSVLLRVPDDAERWEHLVIANFRGQGDSDLLLQATNRQGYRVGRYIAAYSIDDLAVGIDQPLWQRDDYLGCTHSGARVADLDQDGRDEILGATVIGFRGKTLIELPELGKRAHLDAIYAADVRPEFPGIEVVALEERHPNRVFVFGLGGLLWQSDFKHQEPQNSAIGEFDLDRRGLEIWCRTRFNEDQRPFVFDAHGKKIAGYRMNKVKPKGWTNRGVEVINTIDWTGDTTQMIVAKERHKSGDVALMNPMTGEFLRRFRVKADRLYIADVSGDWREEIIILEGDRLKIYSNKDRNPNPGRDRLWTGNSYKRSKMTHGYYNP